MNVKKNIIQFLPYFPPHIGGVEKVGQELFLKWTYGKSSVISGNTGQETSVYNQNNNSIIDNKKIDFYPSFDIVDNFPVPNIWTLHFWKILSSHKKEIRDYESSSEGQWYIITHTRFFLSSLIGGLFYRFLPPQEGRKLRWIHIEHGSDYVQLSSPIKNRVAYIYDRIIGKWICKRADRVLAISQASKDFIEREFGRKDVEVWYRGIDFPLTVLDKKNTDIQLVFIGRLVALKGVELLIQAYKNLNIELKLTIIGDGPERTQLESLAVGCKINFLGYQDKDFIQGFLSQNNCIVINPSYQEGLPTTVIETLLSHNIAVASDVGGTREISEKEDLLLFSPGNIQELQEKVLFAQKNFFELQGKSYDEVRKKFSWEQSIENLYNFL